MKLSKEKLKQIILEEMQFFNENPEEEGPGLATKVKSGVKTKSVAAQDARTVRADSDPEISNNEHAILAQVDDFLLKLAAIPGVELNNNRPQIQQILKLLKSRIADRATGGDQ